MGLDSDFTIFDKAKPRPKRAKVRRRCFVCGRQRALRGEGVTAVCRSCKPVKP